MYLGIDVGSVSTKFAIIDEDKDVVTSLYIRTEGDPILAVKRGLREIGFRLLNKGEIKGVVTTGSARYLVGILVNADMVKNEIICHALGTLNFIPEAKTIIDIGGQDSKIIIIRDGIPVDFSMNTICAAGTGSFLDHQATRLGIPIEEFGEYAIRAKTKVNIAGRCLTEDNYLLTLEGVKSIKNIKRGDFILSDGRFREILKKYKRVYSGKLYKIIRRYSKDLPLTITSGHPILAIKSKLYPYKKFNYICREDCHKSIRPKCQMRFYKDYSPQWIEVDFLNPYDLIVTPKHNTLKLTKDIHRDLLRLVGYYLAEGYCYSGKGKREDAIEFSFNEKERKYHQDVIKLMESFFSITLGSKRQDFYTGRGVVLRFWSKKAYRFFKQFGIGASNKRIPKWIFDLPKEYLLELIKGFWRGDGSFSKNSLTMYTCSRHLFEGLCVILEKCGYIPGKKKYFEKNLGKVASRLKQRSHDIVRRNPLYKIELGGRQIEQLLKDLECGLSEEFKIRLKKRRRTYQIAYNKKDYILYPVRKIEEEYVKNIPVYNLEVKDSHSYLVNGFLCHNCTVFAESDMVHKQQLGFSKADIINGLCKAIVRNYLNNVAKGKEIFPPVVFQGGVAANKGVKIAFEEELGMEIIVPKHYDVMGAIGAAILAKEEIVQTKQKTNFNFNIAEIDFKTRSFDCGGCPNHCEVIEVLKESVVVDRFGSRCRRWEVGAEDKLVKA
jgi:predicted CoA-substrate-specific enzyme activase